jgi:hypothetical protein
MNQQKLTEEQPLEGMAEAIAHEQQLAAQAEQVRGESVTLTPALFLQLWPILCEPIPSAFIQHVEAGTGKPYASTGIRSVQVQIDRMNNVLTPLWWWDVVGYEQQGKLCHVAVCVGDPTISGPRETVTDFGGNEHAIGPPGALIVRSSWGGVDRGSSAGNVYKGSYTNAAKRAFAALGVGHEIYLGTTDLDPDVSQELAESESPPGGKDLAGQLYDRANDLGLKDQLRLAASHVVQRDVGDCATKAKAVKALQELTVSEMERLDSWLSRKADEQA